MASSQPMGVNSANFYPYVNLLASIYRGRPFLPDQDAALAADPNVWEKVQEDPVVRTGIQTRLHKVAGCPRTMQPGGDDEPSMRFAEGFEDIWDNHIANLDSSLYNLAKSVFQSRTYGYIEGERRPYSFAGGPVMDWWLPTKIADVGKQRMRLVPVRGQDKKSGSVIVTKIQEEISALDGGGLWVPLSQEQSENFIRVVYDDDESRLGMGRGILSCIYFYVFAKGIVWKERLNAIELYTRGMALLKVDQDRPGSVDRTNDAVARAFLDKFEKMRGRYAMVVGKGEEVDVKWPTGSNEEARNAIKDLDEALLMVITGSVLPTGAGSDVGSEARANVEQDSADDLIAYDRKLLDAALTRGLIGQFVRNNRPQLAKQGLLLAKQPKIISVNETRQSPKEAADVAAVLLGAGVKLLAKEVYEKTGYTKPKPGEEVIEGMQAQAPGLPGDRAFGSGNPTLDRAKQRIEENKRMFGGGGETQEQAA